MIEVLPQTEYYFGLAELFPLRAAIVLSSDLRL